MKKILTAIMALAGITACSDQQKVLVLYYSQYGATKTVAEEFAAQMGADIEAFDVDQPYDGDFNATIQRCLAEQAEGKMPKCNPLSVDLSKYDVIFLGYPIWFGVAAPPVAAMLQDNDLNGKTIVPFCTFGSGGLESSVAELKKALPDAQFCEGYGVRNARVAKCPDEIAAFLVNAGFMEGIKDVLPEFSAQQPVGELEAVIFDEACGSYPMPLGTPLSVGSRVTPTGTEYLFTTESQAPDGGVSTAQIYVLSEDGAAPEFIKAVR